jgi:hypothetical protein
MLPTPRCSKYAAPSGRIPAIGVFLACLAAALQATAQTGSGPARNDTASFDIIETRNIFDTTRLPKRVVRERTTVTPPTPRAAPQVEYITCVGTMKYEKSLLAFFEGSRSAYSTVGKVSNSVANFKIAAIEPEYVRLVTSSNDFYVPVGSQLRQEGSGPWRVAAVTVSDTSSSSASRTRTTSMDTRSTGFSRNQQGRGGMGGGFGRDMQGMGGRGGRGGGPGMDGGALADMAGRGNVQDSGMDASPGADLPMATPTAADALNFLIQRAVEDRMTTAPIQIIQLPDEE